MALLTVWVVWGSTYLGIRVAIESMPPLVMAGARFLIAGLIMLPAGLRAGRPTRAQWAGCAVAGTLMLGANAALSVAERTVPTGLASLLIATVPLWLLGFDAALNRARIGLVQLLGLLVGLAGAGFLSGSARGSVSVAGVAICLFSAAAWAFGTLVSRRAATPGSPVRSTAMQMIAGGVAVLIAAGAGGEFGAVRIAAVSERSWAAFAYLVLIGSIVGFSAYMTAVRSLPVAVVATYAYVNPVIAVMLGILLLNERVSASMAAGGILIIGAVVLVVRHVPAHLSWCRAGEA